MRPASFLFFVYLLLGGCVGREQSAPKADPRRTAQEIWAGNEAVIQRALDGRPSTDEEYAAASRFFSRLTGIELRSNMGWVVSVPTTETREDLERVRAWYSVNGDRLYWDDKRRSVILRPRMPQDLEIERRNNQAQALAEWARHSMAISRSVYGAGDIESFRRSREFFLALTGIEIPADESDAGPIPNEETMRGLESLGAWLEENRHRLLWDESTESVILDRGASTDSRVIEAWSRHEEVLIAVQKGQDFKAVDFDRACKFFYHLTGIHIPAEHTPVVDCYPTPRSAEALPVLRRWYAENRACLYYEEGAAEVRLRRECPRQASPLER